MRNYSPKEKEKIFILKYSIEDNQIIVTLASGQKYIIPYSKVKEEDILNQMGKQVVLYSAAFKARQKEKLSAARVWAIINGIVLVVNAFLLAKGGGLIPILLVVGSLLNTAYQVCRMIYSNINIKDVDKYILFLEKEDYLNEEVKSNPYILKNNPKIKNLVFSTPDGAKPFTLNSIDGLSYNELASFIHDIENYHELFGPENSSTEEEKNEEEQQYIQSGSEVLENSDDFEDYSQLEQEETINEQEEPIKEDAKPVYSGNLENLFLNSSVEDIKPEEKPMVLTPKK